MLTLPLKNWTGTELDQTVTGLDYTGTGTGLGWIGTGLELPSAHLTNNTEIDHVCAWKQGVLMTEKQYNSQVLHAI